jgi:hypothetical protein
VAPQQAIEFPGPNEFLLERPAIQDSVPGFIKNKRQLFHRALSNRPQRLLEEPGPTQALGRKGGLRGARLDQEKHLKKEHQKPKP